MSLALGGAVAHATVVTNEDDLQSAITGPQTEITLGDNITITGDLPAMQTHKTINGNGSTLDGNGNTCIDNSGGHDLTLKNITITGCDNTGGDGGAVTSTGGSVTVENSTISDNSAARGGGLFIDSEAFELSNLHIEGNDAGEGGGAFLRASDDCDQANNGLCGRLVDSSISGNTAETSGGTRVKYTAVVDSTVSGNTAEDNVGGIYASGGQIINSTISGNVALGNLGGAYLSGSMMAVSTVTNNTAENVGGLELLGELASESVLLEGVIIAGNNASTPDLQLADPPAELQGLIRYSVIDVAPDGDTLSETGLVDVDPMLGPLADNGGETFTHEPPLDSPARFLVLAEKCAAISDANQRGEPRPSETECSAGFVEVEDAVPDPVPDPVPVLIMSALAVMLSAAAMGRFGWLGLRRRARF